MFRLLFGGIQAEEIPSDGNCVNVRGHMLGYFACGQDSYALLGFRKAYGMFVYVRRDDVYFCSRGSFAGAVQKRSEAFGSVKSEFRKKS